MLSMGGGTPSNRARRETLSDSMEIEKQEDSSNDSSVIKRSSHDLVLHSDSFCACNSANNCPQGPMGPEGDQGFDFINNASMNLIGPDGLDGLPGRDGINGVDNLDLQQQPYTACIRCSPG